MPTTQRTGRSPKSQCNLGVFPRILQIIWEANPDKGPVWVPNMDVIDAYHCSTLRPSQVGVFACVIPLSAYGYCIIIYINLVLPMRWLESPKYFGAFSETLMDVANALAHMLLPAPGYRAISDIPETGPGPALYPGKHYPYILLYT